MTTARMRRCGDPTEFGKFHTYICGARAVGDDEPGTLTALNAHREELSRMSACGYKPK